MDPAEKKKYNQMENVLNKINQKYISLSDEEKKRNTKILEQATNVIIQKMRELDVVFFNLFERKFYGGSYYDNMKVGKPEEYDLDMVFNLPLAIKPDLEVSDLPGFVYVKIQDYLSFMKAPESTKFQGKLSDLMGNHNYLSVTKVLTWIESIFSRALNAFIPKDGSSKKPVISINIDGNEVATFFPEVIKQHPAFTLKLSGTVRDKSVNFDVDLVPCFQFTEYMWPSCGYRSNTSSTRNKFLVVPKSPKIPEPIPNVEKYWRLSFQEQERDLIKGNELKTMKPTIRLLKKLRDHKNHKKIASYYIKTIFLWELQKQNTEFWSQSLSFVFMTMLKKYAQMIQSRNIPYFWNEKNNLIGFMKPITSRDYSNELFHMISDIERNLQDPFTVAKYLLPRAELDILRSEVNLGKKNTKMLIDISLNGTEIGQNITEQDPNCIDNLNQAANSPSLIDINQKTNTLVEMVDNVQQDNKKILQLCHNLLDKVLKMEKDIMELRQKNVELMKDKNSSGTNIDEILIVDNLTLTSKLLSDNKPSASSADAFRF